MWLQPLTWILVPLVGAAVFWNLAWYARESQTPALARLLELADRPPPWPTVAWGLYLAAVPMVALALRVVTPERMGLQGPTSAATAGVAIAIAVSIAAFLLATRQWFYRATRRPRTMAVTGHDARTVGNMALFALFLELHWAFFRAGLLSLGFDRASLAVFLALGVLAIEAWSDPRRRGDLDEPETASNLAEGAALAILSSVTILVTASSILALVLHIAVRGAWLSLTPAEQPPAQDQVTRSDPGIEPVVV
jgi:hypothetical protein